MAAMAAFALQARALKVFEVDRSYDADVKIMPVEHEYQADLKVYFTDKEYRAKWNKPKRNVLIKK